jgi:hypothetical protein
VLFVVMVVSASGLPREGVVRERENPVVRAVKRVIRALGDGLTIPGTKP